MPEDGFKGICSKSDDDERLQRWAQKAGSVRQTRVPILWHERRRRLCTQANRAASLGQSQRRSATPAVSPPDPRPLC